MGVVVGHKANCQRMSRKVSYMMNANCEAATQEDGSNVEALYDPISYEKIKVCSDYILGKTTHRPKIGIICGSGLGGLAELIKDPDGFPVLIMQGRFHSYEGYPLWKTAMPVRVMKLVGVETLIATNAGGGLNNMFTVGDIMMIKDHINLPGFSCQHPLRGPNDQRFGPRFFPTNDLYNKKFRDIGKQVARSLNLDGIVREGVYVMVGGPNYETVAELKMLRELGVDAVGMSTIPETIVAHHAGIKVFACSLITNMCVVEYNTGIDTNHQEVIEWGRKRANDMKDFIARMVEVITNNP